MSAATWMANGTVVRLDREDGLFIVGGPSGHQSATTVNGALGRVAELLHRIFAGVTGLSGWSLVLEFPGIRASYGDAPRNRGGGGPSPDAATCANRIYDPRSGPHEAVSNSIEIVRNCWSPE